MKSDERRSKKKYLVRNCTPDREVSSHPLAGHSDDELTCKLSPFKAVIDASDDGHDCMCGQMAFFFPCSRPGGY